MCGVGKGDAAEDLVEPSFLDVDFIEFPVFTLRQLGDAAGERTIGTAQLLLAKPAARPAPLLGNFDA